MSWKNESRRHSMASRGISSALVQKWKDSGMPIEDIARVASRWHEQPSKETENARRKLSKSNMAIDHLEDIHNLYVDKNYNYDIPYNELLDYRELEQYSKPFYSLTYGKPSDSYYSSFNFGVSPSFETKEELNDWWLANKSNLTRVVHSHKFTDSEKRFDESMDDYDGEYLNTEYTLDVMHDMVNKFANPPKHTDKDRYVNVYRASQGYGGAEEGGWWYDTEEMMYSIRVKNNADAKHWEDKLKKEYPRTGRRSSAAGGADYNVRISYGVGSSSPMDRPRYM